MVGRPSEITRPASGTLRPMQRILASVAAASFGLLGCKSSDGIPEPSVGASEQGLKVEIWLSQPGLGSSSDRESILELEDALVEAMKVNPKIEVDGHEFGEGKAVLFLYGPDADEMFRIAKPLLLAFPSMGPKRVVRRYGSVFDPESKEVATNLWKAVAAPEGG